MRFAAVVLISLAACARPASGGAAADDAVPTEAPAGAPTLDFRPGAGSTAGDGEQRASAEGGSGSIEIRGSMMTPTPCYRLAGALDASNRSLTVTVTGSADPDAMCVQAIGAVPYTGTVRGVAPGTYAVRIVHAYTGTGWQPATPFDAQVTVR